MPLIPTVLPRLTIRNAAVQLVLAANTMAGTRVFGNPVHAKYHADTGKLPLVSIYTLSEQSEVRTETPREYKLKIELAVDCLIAEAPAVSTPEQLDTFCAQVMDALLTDETVNDTCQELLYLSCETVMNDEGSRPFYGASLKFTAITYLQIDPTGPIGPDFDTLDLQIRLPTSEHPTELRSEDIIEIPQT